MAWLGRQTSSPKRQRLHHGLKRRRAVPFRSSIVGNGVRNAAKKMLSILHALLAPFRRDSGDRSAPLRSTIDTSASAFLIFTVIALLLILAILETDLHRDELRALGLIGGEARIDSALTGP